MIKIITWITKLIVLLLSALFLGSCHFDYKSIKGSGKIITENRKIEKPFTGIDVSDAIQVTLKQADEVSVVVEADDNLVASISTEVKNGVLHISNIEQLSIHNGTRKVIVSMPTIESIETTSASNLESQNTIKGSTINIISSSASSIHLNLEMDEVNCDSSSGSRIKIKGLALKLKAESSSGSQINNFDLLANEVTADASSGSTIEIHPIVSLKADASSGASVLYNSVPKTISKNSSSGGNIEHN